MISYCYSLLKNFHHKKSELQDTVNKLHEMNARIEPAVLSEK